VNGQGVPCLFILIEYANSGNLAQHLFVSPEQADDGAYVHFLVALAAFNAMMGTRLALAFMLQFE
jgi:hypothetical protein